MLPTDADVSSLLNQARTAATLDESQDCIARATAARNAINAHHAQKRELDLGDTAVSQVLTPVRVHERNTTATDWMGGLATTAAADRVPIEQEMTAQGTLWYSRIVQAVREDTEEFGIQAEGKARHLSGAYGELADAAESAFLTCVADLRNRDLRAGTLTPYVAATGLPQVGEGGYPAEEMAGLQVDNALPGEATSSERAPAIQELEANNGPGASQDVTPVNDPGIARSLDGTQPSKQTAAGRKEQSMSQHAQCPTCKGNGRVAVRVAPQPSIVDIIGGAGRRVANSGLPQVDQIANADDSPGATPLPTEVAWPWEMNPNAVGQTIQTAEQQIAEREQRKGASLAGKSREELAEIAARRAYVEAKRQVLGGQDDSGWLGDMGAGGVAPGQQDGGNPPGSNLGAPDPVYGYGGDNGNRPLKPYGADEAEDYTNNEGQMWQPGQPTQMDMGGRGMSTASRVDNDPELQKALAFARQRRAFLEAQQGRQG